MSSLTPPHHPGQVRSRLRPALLIAVVMSFFLALIVSSPASAADPLLSQGKPATASSAENVAFPATAAVDGDPGTR